MDLIFREEAYKIVGACMEVHRTLGEGFLESVYQEALERELQMQAIPHIREQRLQITYKGFTLDKYYVADFVCFNSIIVELKALPSLTTQHEAQMLNYLKATNLQLGLLVNFGTKSLEYKRIIKTHTSPK
ncbi:MAG: GxxExxY protein [Cytophagia bacterium]|nr:MAG: GxxExxY protein [Cytophagales bacterium]TAG35330.1 MAG: GxxExxY protein [Cytophagia bacterium]TAG72967.1 MAG: GxxExxY protein [Runella slithyformis]TAG77229.1 MAG: GxxExxY protein [Cytophagales bacterium]